jgi:hypothetical protein
MAVGGYESAAVGVGDDLDVDEDAIAVEDDQLQIQRHGRRRYM